MRDTGSCMSSEAKVMYRTAERIAGINMGKLRRLSPESTEVFRVTVTCRETPRNELKHIGVTGLQLRNIFRVFSIVRHSTPQTLKRDLTELIVSCDEP